MQFKLSSEGDLKKLIEIFSGVYCHGEIDESIQVLYETVSDDEKRCRLTGGRWKTDETGNIVVKQSLHCIATCRLPIDNFLTEPLFRCVGCFRMYVFLEVTV